MLVLSRREDESIIIEGRDGPVEVCVVRILYGDRDRRPVVRLGIQAPPEVTVDRKEIYEAKRGITK